jgi:adenylate cyclase
VTAIESALERLYRRLGPRYPAAVTASLAFAGLLFAPLVTLFFSVHVPMDAREFALVSLIAALPPAAAGTWGLRAAVRCTRPLRDWLAAEDRGAGAVEAWRAAIAAPRIVTLNAAAAGLVAAPPAALLIRAVLDLDWPDTLVALGGGTVAALWLTIIASFLGELVLSPVVEDVARCLPARFVVDSITIPLRAKLLGALLSITLVTGSVVVVLADPRAGLVNVVGDFFLAAAVTATVSFGLTLIVVRSLLAPLQRLHDATRRVAGGDLSAHVPVASDDELGALSSAFNAMTAGMRERETLRDVVGSYVHPEVARRVVDEGVELPGREADVTVLFVDIRNFTSYAESVSAAEAMARLNEFFDLSVSVIRARGGHANKFLGDGMLAVFGAPDALEGHADHALSAACELVEAVERAFRGQLRVGVGLSSGPALAGTIGGGGHLEYSVVGDPVNVASRVEQMTKATGDPVLLTEETRRRLVELATLVEPRGEVELRGKARPVPIYAPRRMAGEGRVRASRLAAEREQVLRGDLDRP